MNLDFKLLKQELNTGASLKAHKTKLEKRQEPARKHTNPSLERQNTGACPEAHESKLGKTQEPAPKHTQSLRFGT
jgi:hypothetical protein